MGWARPLSNPLNLHPLTLVGFSELIGAGDWWVSLARDVSADTLIASRVVILAVPVDDASDFTGWRQAGSGRAVFGSMGLLRPKDIRDGDLIAARWHPDSVWRVGIADQAGEMFGMLVDEAEIRPLTDDPDDPRIVLIARARAPQDWQPRRRRR